MSYHTDEECNSAIIRLMDALCTHERTTSRRSTLIIIPHTPDENIVVAVDGKPVPTKWFDRILEIAGRERSGK